MTSLSGEMIQLSDSCSTLFKNSTITSDDLEQLLSLKKNYIDKWLKKNAPKYVAHIHCFKGKTSDGQKLTGWSTKKFTVLRSYLMCRWSTRLKSPNLLSQNQKLQTVIKLNLLAHWILSNREKLLEGKNITALADYVKKSPLLLGLGYKSHAIYTLIKWEGKNKRYIIRIYNTGAMKLAHSTSYINQCIYPFVAYIKSKPHLKHYIRRLLEAKPQRKRYAMSRIYSPLLRHFMAQEVGSYRGTGYKAQVVGNCVLANHNAFMNDFLSSEKTLLDVFYQYELNYVADKPQQIQNVKPKSLQIRFTKSPSPENIPGALDTFLRRLFLNQLAANGQKKISLPDFLLEIKAKTKVVSNKKVKKIYLRVHSQFQILLNAAEKGRVPKEHSLLSTPSISEIINDKSIQRCIHTPQYFKFLKGVTLYFKNTNASIFNSLHGWQNGGYLPAVCFSDFILNKQSPQRKAGKNQSSTDKNLSAYFKSLFLQLEKQYSTK